MVWWGLRALKTPEERFHCRRFSVGWLISTKQLSAVQTVCNRCASGVHLVCIDWTKPGQRLDIYWTTAGRTGARRVTNYALTTTGLQPLEAVAICEHFVALGRG